MLVSLFAFGLAGARRRVQAGMVAAGMDWLEVALLSVRFAEVWLGIRQGKIVDCGSCLAVRMLASVGYGVGK